MVTSIIRSKHLRVLSILGAASPSLPQKTEQNWLCFLFYGKKLGIKDMEQIATDDDFVCLEKCLIRLMDFLFMSTLVFE